MYKIIFLLLLSFPLFAGFFPQTVESSISTISGDKITLNNAFPVDGMSGIVIHNYGNDLSGITTYLAQTKGRNARLIVTDILPHKALPSIKTTLAKNDRVVGGYLYENVLLLAPDADTYAQISSDTSRKWIHPDLFAVYLSTEGEGEATRENLALFAKQNQIGLIYIVRRDSAVLLDPISGKIVGKKAMSGLPKKAKFPFYMRFQELETGWFGSSVKGDFYQAMEAL